VAPASERGGASVADASGGLAARAAVMAGF